MAPQKQLHTSGLWFREKRRAAKLTQKAVADMVDVDRSYIAQIEAGMRWPTKPRLYAIFSALGVPIDVAITELHLAPNDEAERLLRFRELMEEVAPHIPAKRLKAFDAMFATDDDSYRWMGQWVLSEPLPAAPDGWLRLNAEDRRLMQRMVNRLLATSDYAEEVPDGNE